MGKVVLNGKETDFQAGADLRAFLRERKIGTENLILEWNGKILTDRDSLETIVLKDGDAVNLFSMVGGG